MKYKIIAVDMDGTLLNDEKSISKYNLDMVCEAEKLGVKIVMATGRLPSSLKFYSRDYLKISLLYAAMVLLYWMEKGIL